MCGYNYSDLIINCAICALRCNWCVLFVCDWIAKCHHRILSDEPKSLNFVNNNVGIYVFMYPTSILSIMWTKTTTPQTVRISWHRHKSRVLPQLGRALAVRVTAAFELFWCNMNIVQQRQLLVSLKGNSTHQILRNIYTMYCTQSVVHHFRVAIVYNFKTMYRVWVDTQHIAMEIVMLYSIRWSHIRAMRWP